MEFLGNPQSLHETVWVDSVSVKLNETFETLSKSKERKADSPEQNTKLPVNVINACKTIVCWSNEILTSYRTYTSKWLIKLFPEIISMQEIQEEDLQSSAKRIYQFYFPLFSFPPSFIHEALSTMLQYLTKSSENTSWYLKTSILPALQIAFFKNLHLLTKEAQSETLKAAVLLLSDSRVEVRQLASVTLSGMVRCSQREVIQSIRDESMANLTAAKLPKKRPGAELPPNFAWMVTQRHGSVLALSALILAFPYEVPAWVPSALMCLARCSNDPSPINLEVSRTFSEFRRTHQDTWHEDRTKFTSEQLEELSDLLISPSYYV
jgi:proteasome activator subunit 4